MARVSIHDHFSTSRSTGTIDSVVDTRVVFPQRDVERLRAQNSGTLIFVPDLAHLAPLAPPSFEEVFRRHYGALAKARRALSVPGVVVAAVHGPSGSCQILCLAAKEKTSNSAIIGRHGRCDLYLDGDPGLSLRHLAVLVGSASADPQLPVRVLDLHTPRGFVDENDRRLSALRSDGPIFLRVASYLLMVLPVVAPWPADAEEAWQSLPPRSYGDARKHESPVKVDDDIGQKRDTPSEIVALDGPLELEELPAPAAGSAPLGVLVLTSEHGREDIAIGPNEAARGILLGRYRRCASPHLIALANRRLSRVHLLIVDTGFGLFAVDTASTNPTRCGSTRIRSTPLEAGTRLTLPGDVELEWRPAASS